MKNSATHKTIGYRLVSGFLLLWALAYAGLVVFSFLVAGPEHWQAQVDSGRISAEYVVYIEQIPVWAILLTFIVAISRLLGALSLVYRPQWSLALFSLSLLGTVIVMYRGFFIAGAASVISDLQVAIEISFLGLSVFAALFAGFARSNQLIAGD